MPKRADLEKAAYFIRAYYYAKRPQNFDNFLEQKAVIAKVRQHLQGLMPVEDTFLKAPDEKFIEEIFKNVNGMKSENSMLVTLRDALEELKTISEVICKIANHQSADNKKEAKSSNRFNSYRGFPNGTESWRELLTALGSEGKIPSKYRNSKLPERTDSLKIWMEKMINLLDKARGLIGVYEICSNAQKVEKFEKKAGSQGTKSSSKNLFDNLRSLSSQKISEAISTLVHIEDRIEFFEKSTWAKSLYDEMKSISSMPGLNNWDEPFWAMPIVSDFFILAMEDFKKFGEGKLDIEGIEKAERMKLHKIIMSHLDRYMKLVPSLVQFSHAVQNNEVTSEMNTEQVEGMKSKLVVLNDIKDKDLPSRGDVTMDRLQAGLSSYTDVKTVTNGITEWDAAPLEGFFKDVEDVELLKQSILPLPATFNLTTTKSLLDTLAASSIGEIPGISGEANPILSNIMAGTPFGSEVLQDLATGVSAFNKLMGGIDVSKLAEEISLVKADGEANGAIGKLMDGAEFAQIPADPSNVYSLFADDVNLPRHIKKLSDWISRILEADHQTEKAYLKKNKEKFGTLHALILRVEKPMDSDFKLLSDRIEFIFRVLRDDGKLGSGSIIIIVIVVLLLIGLLAGGGFFGYKRWAKIKAKGATSKESASSKKDKLKKERKDEKKGKSVANGSKEVV